MDSGGRLRSGLLGRVAAGAGGVTLCACVILLHRRGQTLTVRAEAAVAEAQVLRAELREARDRADADRECHARQLVAPAVDRARVGDVAAAMRLLDLALAWDPTLAGALLLKAQLVAAGGDFSGALSILERQEDLPVCGHWGSLMAGCRRALRYGTPGSAVAVVTALQRAGLEQLARDLEQAQAPGLLGDGDPTFGRVMEVLRAWPPEILRRWLRGNEETKGTAALSAALAEATDCRWATAAGTLRRALFGPSTGGAGPGDLSASLLFAFEHATRLPPAAVAGLFSAQKATYCPETGSVVLRYEHGVEGAWEAGGRMPDVGGTVAVPRSSGLNFVIPFRCAGPVPAVFSGRLVEMPGECALRVYWRGTDPRTGGPTCAALVLVSEERGSAWAAAAPIGPNTPLPSECLQALPDRYLKRRHTIDGSLSGGTVSFRMDKGEELATRFVAEGLCWLGLRAEEGSPLFDWLELGGPVDGLWLATILALRSQDTARAYHEEWRETCVRPGDAAVPDEPGG